MGLLKDSKNWSGLRKEWQKTLKSATELLAQLTEQDIFFPDVRDTWRFRKDHRAKPEAEETKSQEQKGRGGPITENPRAAGSTVSPRAEKTIEHLDAGASKPPDPPQKLQPAPKSVNIPESEPGEPTAGESKAGESESKVGEPKAGESKVGGPTTKAAKASIIKPPKTAIEQQNEVKPKAKVLKMKETKAMIRLTKLFENMQRECEAGITELEKETTVMIGLVSIFLSVTGRSIAADSNRSST